MNIKIILLKSMLLYFIFIWFLSSASFAQGQFLLNEMDMSGFQLLRIETTSWMIRPDSIKHDVVTQVWGNSGIDECYISYSEFDSEVDAIKGTSCELGSYSVAFLFGSPGGEITGNNSWVSLDRKAVFFQKGDIGIKIVRPVLFDAEDPQNILNISTKVLAKINENLSKNNKLKDRERIRYQLSNQAYQRTTVDCNKLLAINGYVEFKTEDSKWLLKDDSLLMGIRKQWSKGQSFISIDVANYSNDIDAQEGLDKCSKHCFGSICLFKEKETTNSAIENLRKKWDSLFKLKYISIFGIKGNTTFHLYYYNRNNIDFELITNIIEALNNSKNRQ